MYEYGVLLHRWFCAVEGALALVRGDYSNTTWDFVETFLAPKIRLKNRCLLLHQAGRQISRFIYIMIMTRLVGAWTKPVCQSDYGERPRGRSFCLPSTKKGKPVCYEYALTHYCLRSKFIYVMEQSVDCHVRDTSQPVRPILVY